MNNDKQELLELYRNYLYSLQVREEYKDKYGDTEELIKMYEEKLEKHSIYVLKRKSR